MTNADKFKTVFGMYSEEFWAKPEGDMLNWINSEYQEPKFKVDVRLVKYGRWVELYDDITFCRCSECEKLTDWNIIFDHNYKYCPNCRAKMDGAE